MQGSLNLTTISTTSDWSKLASENTCSGSTCTAFFWGGGRRRVEAASGGRGGGVDEGTQG